MQLLSFRSGVFLMITLILAGCASVASVVYPLNTEATKIKPGAYALDSSHASVIFSVSHMGFSTYYGRFNGVSGALDFAEEDPSRSRVDIAIEADSIDTNNETLEGMLKAKSMFNAGEHPRITFVSTAVEKTGENTGIVTGDLTIAGVTGPLVLDVSFVGSGTNPASGSKTIGFDATGKFLRSDFGLKNWLPLVGDEVSLQIGAEFNPVKP